MSRSNEIAQGLRHEDGSLTFTLVAEEYAQGHIDFDTGAPAARFSTPSYDLGRARAARLTDDKAAFIARHRREAEEGRARVRAILLEAGDADVLADYDAKMTELDRAHNAHVGETERGT